jgi:hypothetical protein
MTKTLESYIIEITYKIGIIETIDILETKYSCYQGRWYIMIHKIS